ncbi:MAG: DUF58 domain-containing protein [Actinomycetia bacterium]|nr:DUF58 domain-containing protein [Actinomycetes bacterium]
MRRRVGLTTRAHCLLAGGATAVACGMIFGEVDLVRAGCLMAAVPVLAAIVVNRAQVTIASRRDADPARAPVGGDLAMTLTITNRSALPSGALMLEDPVPPQLAGRARFALSGLSGRESRAVAYHLTARNRGRYRAGPLQVRLTDPFGLIDTSRSFTATSTLVVTPRIDPLPDERLPFSLDAGDDAASHWIGSHGADDASTREYRHGDDLRKIHWRSSARTGTLMVRHEERPWQGHTTLLLDLRATAHRSADAVPAPAPADSAPWDERRLASAEWAISAAASIGAQLFESGREVSLIAGGTSRRRFPTALSLIDFLAEARPSGALALPELIAPLREASRDGTVLGVFGALDEDEARAVARAGARDGARSAFALLLDTPGWVAEPPTEPPADPPTGPPDAGPGRADRTGAPLAQPSPPVAGPPPLPAQSSITAQPPIPTQPPMTEQTRAAAKALAAGGWRVAVVRHDDTLATAWHRLLAQPATPMRWPA